MDDPHPSGGAEKKAVVAVGLRGVEGHESYRKQIEALGMALRTAGDSESFRRLTHDRSCGAVLVYCPRGSDFAGEILDAFSAQQAAD